MLYAKISQLQPGMRLARPIYNRRGVLLYERNTVLTASGINSIENFGLWGIYILEPAEPVPPLSKEDIEFEQFQTVSMFQLKDDMALLMDGKAPRYLAALAQRIIRTFGALDHVINFSINLRSSSDYVYKHSLNTAILAAMMIQKLHYTYTEQYSIVVAALLHDIGLLLVPDEIQEKGAKLLSPDEHRLIKSYLEKGYQMLHPDYNDYHFQDQTLKIICQMVRLDHNVKVPLDKKISLLNGTHVLHTASKFDDLTSMNLDSDPVSEISAVRYLRNHSNYYPTPFVSALTKCIHILPVGRCVDFSNGLKGIVVGENLRNFSQPEIILFSNNQRVDFRDIKYQKTFQIADIMRTMDTRIPADAETIKKYVTDPVTAAMAKRYFDKRKLAINSGRW